MKTIFHRIVKNLYFKTLLLFILIQGFFVGVPRVFAQGTNSGGTIEFVNPLNQDSLMGFIDALLGIIITLSIPVIALFIIYAGFLFVSTRGDETKYNKAKKTFLYTVIGTAVILGARVISDVIQGTLGSL